MFKKEISIDNEDEPISKEKHKKNLASVKTFIRGKNMLRTLSAKKNNLISLNKNRKKHKIVYENKNIIINDITKNYDSNTINKKSNEKKKLSIINKLSNDYSPIDNSKYKYEALKTETNLPKINNNYIKTITKLNLEKKIGIKNPIINRTSLMNKRSKKKFKSSYNDKIKCTEKKNFSKNKDFENKNSNKKNKIGFGDSYEFNFTFNNFNNNYSYCNSNENILKEEKKTKDKIVIDNFAKENIINKFQPINPSDIRNNILGGLRNILSKNKSINFTKQSKNIGANQKVRKKNKEDKNYYAIKIQKIFRGHNYRQNNPLKNKNHNYLSNFGIYIRKKILNSRGSLNSNLNNTDNYLNHHSLLVEKNNRTNINNSKNIGNNNNLESESKIQEIIIDKKKVLRVLNPTSKKKNNIKEIHINNNYSLRKNLLKIKNKLKRYFIYWSNFAMKKKIIQKLIQNIKSKSKFKRYNNLNKNLKYQNNIGNNGSRFFKRYYNCKNNIFI